MSHSLSSEKFEKKESLNLILCSAITRQLSTKYSKVNHTLRDENFVTKTFKIKNSTVNLILLALCGSELDFGVRYR